jgi:uncharacterized protein
MNEPVMPWAEMLNHPRRNLLARKLYLVMTEPAGGKELILQSIPDHVAYQNKLEAEGIMFAAGPVSDEAEQEWLGSGIFIYRAESLEEATKFAAADPMHSSGARSFTVRAWLVNEGTLSIRVNYASGKTEIV